MSVTGKGGVGVPALLLHEGEGLTLTVETKDGTLYRGRAEVTEDNMNVSLREVTAFLPTGGQQKMDRVFIRGPRIVFVVFPEILTKAPFFERVRAAARGKVLAVGLGRGRQAAIQAKVLKKTIEATRGPPAGPGGPGFPGPMGRPQFPAPGGFPGGFPGQMGGPPGAPGFPPRGPMHMGGQGMPPMHQQQQQQFGGMMMMQGPPRGLPGGFPGPAPPGGFAPPAGYGAQPFGAGRGGGPPQQPMGMGRGWEQQAPAWAQQQGPR